MGRFQEAISGIGRRLASGDFTKLEEAAQQNGNNLELLQERLAELELAQDDAGWSRLSGESETEFSREYLRKINVLARIYWLKNPLIKRAIAIQTTYVFGQGVNIMAKDETVNEVVQAFLDDPKNQAELTSHQARMQKETELQLFSNVFFAFFVNPSTGRTRVRTINPDEIEDIVYNPEDAKDPWYYKRVWTKRAYDLDRGEYVLTTETRYYPDWRYNPSGGHRATIGGHPVEKVPVYHVAVNKLSDMKFGVSETYAAQAWAKAYNEFLGNWATIVKSYARFAWNYVSKTAKGVQSVATKLGNALGISRPSAPGENPQAGNVFVNGAEGKLEPIKTGGATTKAEDGRRLLLQVSAAMGIFEHYFGDPSTGNLATAKSMERPMELMFLDRQALWRDVFLAILNFVIDQAAKAPSGALSGREEVDEDGELAIVLDESIDRHIAVTFPPLLEKDIESRIRALISASTLEGKTLAGTMDLVTLTRLLLVALEVDDADEILEQLFPGGKVPEAPDNADPATVDPEADLEADTQESKADRLLRQAITDFSEALAKVTTDAA